MSSANEPGPNDRRMPPPARHPATREELLEYGRTYAIYEEEKEKGVDAPQPKKRVLPVDKGLEDIINEWERAEREADERRKLRRGR